MQRERRIRDEDGDNIYYFIDESDELQVPSGTGAGVFSEALGGLKNVASSVATKLTGKTAKKIAEKALEKGLEKGAEKVGEKVGEKTGQLLGEKIYDRFRGDSPRKGELAPQVGDQIIKELQRDKRNQKGKKPPPEKARTRTLSQQFDELLNSEETRSISQQFDELLSLN